MKRIALFVLTILLALTASNADACRRCGFRKCRFVNSYVKPAVIVAPATPQTIILQYNAPVPLAQAGASTFGYSSGGYGSTNFFPIDVNLFANLESRIATQALDNIANLQVEGILATNILAETFGRAALVNSATQQLAVALGTRLESAPTSLRLRFNGQSWQVEDDYSATRDAGQSNIQNPPFQDVLPPTPGLTTFSQKCISCHAKDDNPDLSNIDSELVLQAIYRMRLPVDVEGHMPKDGEITEQEQRQISNELLNYMMEG